jgi:hypothetical protein
MLICWGGQLPIMTEAGSNGHTIRTTLKKLELPKDINPSMTHMQEAGL